MADMAPIIDPRLPALLRANAAGMGVPPPISMAMPAPMPSLGSAPMPLVARAPTQTETDQAKLNGMVNTGTGISQIQNPVLHSIAKFGDIAGVAAGTLLPALRPLIAQIPGTTDRHNLLVHQMRATVANDQANDLQGAQVKDAQAQADQRTAAAQREIAKAGQLDDPTKALDPSKTVETADGVFQLNPATGHFDTKVGDSKSRPLTIEQQAYDAAIQGGQKPMEALASVYGAKNTKDAGLPQQYLDAISSGDTVKAGLIKKAINDTSTQPKIDVHTATAAPQVAGLPSGPGGSVNPTVQAIIDGRVPAPNVRTKQGMALMQQVTAADPSYDASRYNTYQASQKDATSGKTGAAINSLNTIQEHIGRALTNIPHNGSSPFLNSMENAFGAATGSNPTGKFDVDATGIAGEWGKLVAGGVASEGEQKHVQALLNKNGSPAQIRQNLEEVRQMTLGKLQGIQRQVQSGSHPGNTNNPVSSLPSANKGQWNPKTGRYE